MSSPNRRWEAILDYPSRESVTGLVIALVERSSSVIMPERWPENESIYLQDDDATRFLEFRHAINGAIIAAEPADWLLRELKDFERMIAELAIADLQSTEEGRATLDAIRATAVARFLTEQHRQGKQSDDER